ncbi:MAG: efflux RND transporter periplasmic adaptor subunit [Deltaproteobacteria bacterium]|nr:efflux RND transporter periplasmic adaptor subunit [Deltaproteobacteria bacterium]
MNEKISDRRQIRKKGKQLPLFFLLLTAGLFLTGCGEKAAPGDAQVKRPPIRGVSIATLVSAPVDEFYEATGTVKAAQVSVVAGRMMGAVTSLLVKEGDPVEKGQLLLTIDDRDVAQKEKGAEAGHREAIKALESAQQNRELTDITYRRYKKMHEEKAISRQEMDQFETQNRLAGLEYERVQEMVDRAAAGLAEARIYRGFARVTSPIRGVVTEKRTEAGSMAVPGMPLLTVESAAAFQAEIAVDESLSGRLKIGAPVFVSIEALNRQMTGKIVEILPAVDPLSRSFMAKVSVSGPGLRTGLYAKVRIPKGKKEVLLAPRPAIVEKGQLTGVYAVDGQGIITYRLVRTGRAYDGRLEILSGLKTGDRIIVGGVEKAEDGGVVEKGK